METRIHPLLEKLNDQLWNELGYSSVDRSQITNEVPVGQTEYYFNDWGLHIPSHQFEINSFGSIVLNLR